MREKLAFLATLVNIVLASANLLWAQFYALETKDLELLYYNKAHEYVVPHLARCFENAYRFHHNIFHYTPSEKITVLLQDFGDFAGGGAGTLPYNQISVGISPFNYVYETMTANERMNTIMNHELVHIVTLDQAAGRDRVFRSLFFGKGYPTAENPLSMLYLYLTSPRWGSPRWYTEGIAVFMETWMAGGLGRALGAYDEMVFRTMVRDSSYFYDIVGLESEGTKVDFQVGANSYLYGTRFMSYMAYRYGPEKLIQWTSRRHGSRPYFSSQFKKVYGLSLNEAWAQWIRWEDDWQRANLDSIRTSPTTPFRSITDRSLGSVSRAFYDKTHGQLYAAIRYPGQVAHIAALDVKTGRIRKLCDVKGAALFYVTSLAYDQSTNTLFYTTDNNGWRDLNAVDITTKKSRRLIKDCRTGDLAFNPVDRSLWGVRHYLGISTLVRIPYPYTEWNQVFSWPYGHDIFDLDVSPDGSKVIAALAGPDGSQKLIAMDTEKLLAGDNSYDVLFDFDISIPANFVFSPDGTYLYGSSYYSGVSNIYRYDFRKHDMEILTNGETGFFRPVPLSDDSLIVCRYTAKGFVPVKIPIQKPLRVKAVRYLGTAVVERYPQLRNWTLKSPASINLDSLVVRRGKYSTLKNVKLASVYPIVEGYKDFASVGLRADFADRLALSRFDVTATYSPDGNLPEDERLHLGLKINHWNWQFRASYNGADFYDLFGPTKTSRKGYAVGIGYRKSLLFDEPRVVDLDVDVTGYVNLERLPDFQNVVAPFDKLLAFKSSVGYEFVRKSLGAVDEEKGVRWRLTWSSNYVNSTFFPRVHSDVDYGVSLPLNHSSVWLRTSLGASFGNRANPFANFFFGGFGNNYVDRLTEKRYRKYYSFPGVELNEVGGKNYGKAMVEWLLPPIRFRRVGVPAFYFNWARLAFFGTALRTNLDDRATRRTLVNVGGQLDFRLVLFAKLHSTISFGYAAAFEENAPNNGELMFSLKIL